MPGFHLRLRELLSRGNLDKLAEDIESFRHEPLDAVAEKQGVLLEEVERRYIVDSPPAQLAAVRSIVVYAIENRVPVNIVWAEAAAHSIHVYETEVEIR